MTTKKYVLVEWPESQLLMDDPNFDECIPTKNAGEYLCPEDLYNKISE